MLGGVTLPGDANPLAANRVCSSRRRHHRGGDRLAPDLFIVTERFQLETSDGETLEARWDSPDKQLFTTVFCHPSPIEGGSMMAPLMIAVTQKLVARGHAVLRFNFRGVGASTGQYGDGDAEIADTDAAFDAAMHRSDPVGIAGWSFGAAVALNWVTDHHKTVPYVGIAPAVRLLRGTPPSGPKRIILGSREQVVDADALRAYAIEHNIDLVITPGDHFFHGRGKRIGDLVGEGLETPTG